MLQNLVTHQIISQAVCDSLKELPIKLDYSVEQSYDGEALHFRAYLAKYLKEWQEENDYNIYTDGLKIHVTLDSRMQKYADEAVQKQMYTIQRRFFSHWQGENPWQDENHKEIKNFIEDIAKKTTTYANLNEKYNGNADSINKYLKLPKKVKVFDYKLGEKDTTLSIMDSIRYMNHFMHTGFVVMEPNTRHVKAWVGDINFNYWQYDKVAQSKRQPGSTFKLFDYTAAIMNGKAPCDIITDRPITWKYMENGKPKSWSPQNTDWNFLPYPMSLKHAFARSINSVAVQVSQEVGIAEVIKYAHLLGIKTPLEDKPSTCLGSSDVSLLELVNSYGTVINEGLYQDPIVVVRIEVISTSVDVIENVVITDMLPAGLEIENPRLGGSQQFEWIKNASSPTHFDFRDDRVNIFTDVTKNKTQYYYYQTRAVSEGTYKVGLISADAMYDASYHSYHGVGTLVVE